MFLKENARKHGPFAARRSKLATPPVYVSHTCSDPTCFLGRSATRRPPPPAAFGPGSVAGGPSGPAQGGPGPGDVPPAAVLCPLSGVLRVRPGRPRKNTRLFHRRRRGAVAKLRFFTRNLVKMSCFHGPSPTRSSGGGPRQGKHVTFGPFRAKLPCFSGRAALCPGRVRGGPVCTVKHYGFGPEVQNPSRIPAGSALGWPGRGRRAGGRAEKTRGFRSAEGLAPW